MSRVLLGGRGGVYIVLLSYNGANPCCEFDSVYFARFCFSSSGHYNSRVINAIINYKLIYNIKRGVTDSIVSVNVLVLVHQIYILIKNIAKMFSSVL